jgi:EAL domain-containing protein (putative c-di-GMP-specific phosphodiesterase class I)/GGDEF domain-containing protein
MGKWTREKLAKCRSRLRAVLSRTEVLALFPILALISYEIGGPESVLVVAMILPALLVFSNLGPVASLDMTGGLPRGPAGRDAMRAMLERVSRMEDKDSACIRLAVDDWDALVPRWGKEGARDVLECCVSRLRAALRQDDLLADLGDGHFGVVLHPMPVARLAIRDSVTDRLRAALAEPLRLDGAWIRLTASAGHAALRQGELWSAEETLAGAEAALEEAHAAGRNTMRAFVPGRPAPRTGRTPLAEEVRAGLANDAFRPWFQPQIDARTGRVIGFEALARWQHASLGLLAPDRFLDAVADAGQIEALGATIRRQALAALAAWEHAGAHDLTVSVNACKAELRSASFAEQVAWDLDRLDIPPDRLVIEVLETVAAATTDDSILTTLAALRRQGIELDLDDFGVGQASLLSIRRFGIARIKIDRSFVMGIDADKEQQALVGAIVSMAREMNVATLAEGVETVAERDTLTRMGCDCLQGFLIGKPMALSETFDWLADHARANTGEGTVKTAVAR